MSEIKNNHNIEDESLDSTQIDKSPNLNSQNSPEGADIQEIIEQVKQQNITYTETQSTSIPNPSPNTDIKKKVKKIKNTTPPLTLVPDWTINEETIANANQKMIKSQHQKIPIALVFDLNGTLVKRNKIKKSIYLRPHIHEFVEFVMENFYVMSWTTAKPHNSFRIISAVFGPYTNYILCNLTRLHCNILGSYFENPETIKDLEIIWNNTFMISPSSVMRTLPSPPTRPEFKEFYKGEISLIPDPVVRDLYLGIDSNPQPCPDASPLRFDKTNTILLDDTIIKGRSQPDNHLLVPEYKGITFNQTDNSLLLIKDYLQEMAIKYRAEFDKCENEGTEFHFSVQDYMKNNPFVDSNPQLDSETSN